MHSSEDSGISQAARQTGCAADEALDFSANARIAPVTGLVREAIAAAADGLAQYPDREARALCARAAERFGVDPDNVLVGNGATEFIFAIPQRVRPRRVLLVAPCYHDYWRATEHAGAEAEGILAPETNEFVPDLAQIETHLQGVDMMFFGNPNNPTGVAVPAESLRMLAQKTAGCLFVIDEAYSAFVPDAGGASMLTQPLLDNTVVLRSLSSFHALPGLRLGFMIAHRDVCAQVQKTRLPWTVSSASLAVGLALMQNENSLAGAREEMIGERERVRDELARMTGLRVFHSQANFLLLKITRPSLTSAKLCARLLSRGILIRNAAGFRGLNGKFARISIRTKSDNDRLLTAMKTAMDESKWK